MKALILLVFACLLLNSCLDYESSEYINEENRAISDLIFELTDAEYMSKHINDSINQLVIYIENELKNTFFDSDDSFLPSDSVQSLFIPIIEKEISERSFEMSLKSNNVNFMTIDSVRYDSIRSIGYSKYFEGDNAEIGIFSCSRILFNYSKNKGYLCYDFFCGSGCAWGRFIEIEKIKGKWKIVNILGGWIA